MLKHCLVRRPCNCVFVCVCMYVCAFEFPVQRFLVRDKRSRTQHYSSFLVGRLDV